MDVGDILPVISLCYAGVIDDDNENAMSQPALLDRILDALSRFAEQRP